ncbi:MAG: HAD family hydrolase [Sulfurimonas sp.]|uniref:HAD family hydrolase n=1 Tax=Sulfurimonas sp. TaxID=2022749 RepID=UPI00261DF6EC|nr:HAD family hydrolase [Sulfurimonas sp.]MDD2652288.1 HAD family hydrolase [Sulfurimonas sp.]MDD3451543.1 HAD family hydrolase [Sulfurimonas sp.]
MNLALFDFDGTLSSKDSLGEFLKHASSKKSYLFNMTRFLPYFALWQLRIISNSEAKERLFSLFFKGTNEEIFKQKAKEFSLEKLDTIINKERLQILKTHQTKGDRVLVVSASMECWLKPWCQREGIELLSTELEFKDAKFSGKFLTPNCHGAEKAKRIKEHLDIKQYETIYAYGDSSGDTEMLALAHKSVKY